MRIAVNTRFLLPHKMEGFGRYTFETLRRLTTQHPEHQFLFFFDRPYDKRFLFSENITPLVLYPPARHPWLFYLWFEYSVPFMLRRYKADIFLSPDGYLSLSSKVPSVAVIHDLNFEHFPEDLPRSARRYYRHYFPRFARKADRICTISEFSKQDIIRHYDIAPERIDVAYNGVSSDLRPLTAEEKTAARLRFSAGAPYFVFVGALHPRKNLARLFAAFDRFRKETDAQEKLLIIGEKYFWNPEIEQAFRQMEFREEVIFSGHLASADLNAALGAANALAFVSYFEGFGLPVVEAMQCEVPVITSNVTALPEVAGDAALLCDPFSVDAITDALRQMSTDSGLRETLIQKGKQRATRFDWQHTADGLWNSLTTLAHAKGLV